MTLLVIGREGFSGMVPRLPDDRLPEGYAAYALNCEFAHGELRPLFGLGEMCPCREDALPVRSVFTPDGVGFFSWPVYTRAYLWPTTDDIYRRIIYQPEGDGIWVTQTDYLNPSMSGQVGPPEAGEAYRLGVPVPVIDSVLTTNIGFDLIEDAELEVWWVIKNGNQEIYSTKLNNSQIKTITKWSEYDFIFDSLEMARKTYETLGISYTVKLNTSGLYTYETYTGTDTVYYTGGGILVGAPGISGPSTGGKMNYIFRDDIEITLRSGTYYISGKGFSLLRWLNVDIILSSLTEVGGVVYPVNTYGSYSIVAGNPYTITYYYNGSYTSYTYTIGNTDYLLRNRKSVSRPNSNDNIASFPTVQSMIDWFYSQGRISIAGIEQWFRWRIYSPIHGVLSQPVDILLQPGIIGKNAVYRMKTGAVVGNVIGDYVYVAVAENEWGEESAPSDPITINRKLNESFELHAHIDVENSYRRVIKINFYRSTETGGDFFLVDSLDVGDDGKVSFIDTGIPLTASPLKSMIWESPPLDASSLTYVNNGFFVVSSSKELIFSEPYRPHAWPYRMLFPTRVTGILPIEGGVLVTTTDQTWLVLGVHPSTMTQQMLPVEQQGWSSRAMTSAAGAAIYASNDGLVSTFGGQPSLTASQKLFTRHDWENTYGKLKQFMQLACRNGMLIGLVEPLTATPEADETDPDAVGKIKTDESFLLRLDEAAGEMCHIDFGKSLYSATTVDAVDKLYIGTDKGIAVLGDGQALSLTWKSRQYHYAKPITFAACVVYADGPGQIEILADDEVVYTKEVQDTTRFRLPSVPPCHRWAIRIKGTAIWRKVALGASFAELQGA